MNQKKASRVVSVSELHPAVEVQLTIRIDLPGPAHHSVCIHAEPGPMPEHLLDTLLSKGIGNGVNAGVVDSGFPLSVSDVDVEVLRFHISEPLEALTAEEAESLSEGVRDLAREITMDLLSHTMTTGGYSHP